MNITKKVKFRIASILILLLVLFLYRLSPYKVEFLGHYDKIWAHRANSTEKFHSALKYYKGVELDLVYNLQENFLDVNHPPTKSISLKFENYIKTLDEAEYPFLWLDIKNLHKDNAANILDKLLQIFNERQYPLQHVLIETRYPDALSIFTEAGFKTSYYLPYDLRKRNEDELRIEILNIEKIIKEQPEIGISTSHKNYDIIKEHFPNQVKYIWILVPVINKDFITTEEILQDESVEVVLVNYIALKGNR